MGVNGIYGLSGSGINVESMVKAGMLSKQSQYDSMYKNEVKNTWIKSAYSSFYSSMFTFKNTTMSHYKMQSVMNAMSASSSNNSAVTATANGAASAMMHRISVDRLATDAYLLSTDTVSRANTAKPASIDLQDMAFSSFTANGADSTYTVTNKTSYSPDKMANIHYAGQNYTGISYDGTQYTLTGEGSPTTVAPADLLSSGTTFTINGSSVTGDKLSIHTTASHAIDSYDVMETSTHAGTDTALSFTIGDGVPSYGYQGVAYTAAQTTLNGDGTYTFKDADGNVVGANIAETDVGFENKPKTISYTYDDLKNGKTLNDVAADIRASGVNITASYDATTDAFSLYNNTGGKENTIELTATNGAATALLNNLHLGSTDGSTLGAAKNFTLNQRDETTGVDGSATIDGKKYDNLTSNQLTVTGVTYTLNNVTAADSPATISVSQNTDSIIASVNQFVTDYNTMLDSLNSKYYETPYSDYQPLTQSQEASMTSTQVSEWNTKAKSGLLYHSSVIRDIISNMRAAIYTPVDSVGSNYNSAAAIGISSTDNKGHITLDAEKLKKALAADPDCAYQIFASSQDDSTNSLDSNVTAYKVADNYRNTGLANRLYDVMTTSMTSISNYAGTSDETNDQSYLGTLITNLQTKMSSFKTQMDAYEDILYKKYDAMEVAIAQLGSQLSSITGNKS